jgi:hypothetical protein
MSEQQIQDIAMGVVAAALESNNLIAAEMRESSMEEMQQPMQEMQQPMQQGGMA